MADHQAVYELPPSTELEYRPPTPVTLFGTNDPTAALQRMTEIAKELVGVIRQRQLAVKIGQGEHLKADAWTTLGGMVGVVPIVEWTRPLEQGGWEARVRAQTLDGRLVGAAESMCSRSEGMWAKRDDYALRSMAQTRAISRALRAPLGQIVTLAGYETTAAEEMPAEPKPTRTRKPKTEPAAPEKPHPAQKAELDLLLERLATLDPNTEWKAVARQIIGVPYNEATRDQVNKVLAELRASAEMLDEISGQDIPFE
jgi:hypothetical protein